MKITQIAAGSARLSTSRPIGSRACPGATHSGAGPPRKPVASSRAFAASALAPSIAAAGCGGLVFSGTIFWLRAAAAISGHLDLEAAGVGLRVLRVPHHAVHQLR